MSLETFAKNLRYLRQQKRLTQAEVAKRIFVSRPLYSQFESGVRTPRLEVFDRICKFFGADKNAIINENIAA